MIVTDAMLTVGHRVMLDWGVDVPCGAIREAFMTMMLLHYLPPVADNGAPGPYPVGENAPNHGETLLQAAELGQPHYQQLKDYPNLTEPFDVLQVTGG